MKNRFALTCKDPGQFFRDCRGCKHYDRCDYFDKAERLMPQKDQEILFSAIDDFTGEEVEKRGIVIDDARAYIRAHPECEAEYGAVRSGAALIVKETPPSEALHLIYLMDLRKVYKGD